MSLAVLLAVNEGLRLRSGGVSVAVLTDGSLICVLSVVAVLRSSNTRHPPVSPVISRYESYYFLNAGFLQIKYFSFKLHIENFGFCLDLDCNQHQHTIGLH